MNLSKISSRYCRKQQRCRIRQPSFCWTLQNSTALLLLKIQKSKAGFKKAQMEIISIRKSSICKTETFQPSIFIFNFLLFFNKEKKNSPKPKCVGKKVRLFIGAPVHLWLKIFLVYLKLGWKTRFSVLALFISTFRSSSMKIFLFFFFTAVEFCSPSAVVFCNAMSFTLHFFLDCLKQVFSRVLKMICCYM